MSEQRFATLVAPAEFAIDRQPAPDPGRGETRLRVRDCGPLRVCGLRLAYGTGGSGSRRTGRASRRAMGSR